MRSVRRIIAAMALLVWAPALAAQAQQQSQAQSWPSRFVRLVVPGGSGTAADVSARIVAHALSERWGQQVVVENRPGAGGVVGTTQIAQSPPDGYSLLFAQGAPLSLGQSILSTWPQIVSLIAGMIMLYVVGYVSFQRQEVRA